MLVCAQEILLVQVYWPLSQAHQNQLGNRFNLEFRLFIQTVQNNVYTVILCLKNIILLSQLLLKNDSKQIKSECVAIKTQTNDMETYSRRDNLLFHGIDQPANKSNFSCAKAVRKFMVEQLQFNDGDASAVQFVRCHRLPENIRNAQSKPIIVRFKNYVDRELIW